MKTGSNFIDDATRVFSGALGVAQGAASEAQNGLRTMIERLMRDQGYVTRDEFDAVAEMAKNARREVEALRAELAEIKAESAEAAAKTAVKSRAKATPKAPRKAAK